MRHKPSPYHLPAPCLQCGFPANYEEGQYLRKVQEDRFQYESLRRAVQGMIAAGLSPKETLGEIMWRLEIRAIEPPPLEYAIRGRAGSEVLERRELRSRIHPDWSRGGIRRGN